MLGGWLRRWRDEYYTENPVVWLLAKTESELCLRQISAPEPAETGNAPSRLQILKSNPIYSTRYFHWADEREFERTLLAPWHLPSNRWMPVSDQIYLAFASLIATTALILHYALAKSPIWVSAVGVGGVVLAYFLPMARSMWALHSLAQMLTTATPLHIGVSRLTPAHLVYGAVLYGVGRAARASAVYGILPAILVATIAQGTVFRGLPTAILLWGYSVCVGALWVLCTLTTLYWQTTRLYGASRDWVRWQNWLATAASLLLAMLLAPVASCAKAHPSLACSTRSATANGSARSRWTGCSTRRSSRSASAPSRCLRASIPCASRSSTARAKARRWNRNSPCLPSQQRRSRFYLWKRSFRSR
jgi:hypothetical protein